jgi:hypothetical protein
MNLPFEWSLDPEKVQEKLTEIMAWVDDQPALQTLLMAA